MLIVFFFKVILVSSFSLFAVEVQNSSATNPAGTQSSCKLVNGVYHENDFIISLDKAKSRSDCPTQIDYSDSVNKYKSLKTGRCIVYSESKHGGCKKTTGYVEVMYKEVEKISEACGYFISRDDYVKEIPKVDLVAKKNKSDCKSWNHARYDYRIDTETVPGLSDCTPYIAVNSKCLTNDNEIFEKLRDTKLNKVWNTGSLIWSESLSRTATLEEAKEICKSKGAEVPTQGDFASTPNLRNVVKFDSAWTVDEPYKKIMRYEKKAKKRQGFLLDLSSDPNFKMVKPENVDVICIKRK